MTNSELLRNVLDAIINNKMAKDDHEVCKKLKYDHGNLSKVLRGTRGAKKIPAALMLKLSDVFGISLDYLSNAKGPIFQKSNKPYISKNFQEKNSIVSADTNGTDKNISNYVPDYGEDDIEHLSPELRKLFIYSLKELIKTRDREILQLKQRLLEAGIKDTDLETAKQKKTDRPP